MDNKRFTKRHDNGYIDLICKNCPYDDKCDVGTHYCFQAIKEKLAEVEDKLENGTLVELPITDKDILEDIAHRIFDSWNDITGAINNNCSWYFEVLSVINDIVGMVWGITSRQYEAKLRELKGE